MSADESRESRESRDAGDFIHSVLASAAGDDGRHPVDEPGPDSADAAPDESVEEEAARLVAWLFEEATPGGEPAHEDHMLQSEEGVRSSSHRGHGEYGWRRGLTGSLATAATLAVVALLVVVMLSSDARDPDPNRGPEAQDDSGMPFLQGGGERVAGATIEAVPAAMRAQLNLRDGVGLVVADPGTGDLGKAGIRKWDVLLSVNDKPVTTVAQLRSLLADTDHPWTLEVLRGGVRTILVEVEREDDAVAPPADADTNDDSPFGLRRQGRTTAVLLGLRWLRDHQAEDGSWDPVDFAAAGQAHGRTKGSHRDLVGTPSTGWKDSRVGVTGLALLAFLGAGYTHTADDEFAETVKRGLRYLRAVQGENGCFDTNSDNAHFIYGHATCAMAMAEAYGMTGSVLLKGPAQKAVDFIVLAQNQNPDRGHLGWRYGVKPGDSDTSVTGWMVMALSAARTAGLEVPAHCWDGARRHLDDMTGVVNGFPKTGYIQKAGQNARLQSQAAFVPNPSMDSINIIARFLIANDGGTRETADLKRQASLLTLDANLPTTEDPNKRDYYYWYTGSLAMFQMGDEYWTPWKRCLMDSIVFSQRLQPEDPADRTYGSWDANSAWGVAGGRVYATAINCLTLMTETRYRRLAKK